MGRWTFYVLECSDGTYYAGITVDMKRRLGQHNSGLGAKYVAYRRPACLLFTLKVSGMDRSYAQKIERRFKGMDRPYKEEFMRAEGRAYFQLTSGSVAEATVYPKGV